MDEDQYQIPSLHNLKGNPLATIDVETTGRIGGYHEIIQIAIVPLTLELEIAKEIQPFYQNIRPEFPERAERSAHKVHGLDIDSLLVNAPTQERVMDYLLEWFTALPLGFRRKLTPVAHNWGFERSFLVPWLGPELFNEVFHPHPRDTMQFALMVNDRAALLGKEIPFSYVNLPYLCRQMGVELNNAHDALADSVACAELYQKFMRMWF